MVLYGTRDLRENIPAPIPNPMRASWDAIGHPVRAMRNHRGVILKSCNPKLIAGEIRDYDRERYREKRKGGGCEMNHFFFCEGYSQNRTNIQKKFEGGSNKNYNETAVSQPSLYEFGDPPIGRVDKVAAGTIANSNRRWRERLSARSRLPSTCALIVLGTITNDSTATFELMAL